MQKVKRVTPKHIEQHLAATNAQTVGDIERLAGVNTFCRQERLALWRPFSSQHIQPGEGGWLAVKAACLSRAAWLVNSGQMCLVGAAKMERKAAA